MNDKETPDPAAQLQAAPEQPKTQMFFMVSPGLMQQVIERLGKLPANKVHGLLNALNQAQSATVEVKPDG